VEAILNEKKKNGDFKSIIDVVQRLSLRVVNKKCLDSMAMGGAFDCFTEIHRAQYFAPSGGHETFIEHLLRFGQSYQDQKASMQTSLFGDIDLISTPTPVPPVTEPWPLLLTLEREKEVTGIFLSGHPLDEYQLEMNHFITHTLNNAEGVIDRPMKLAGIISEVIHGVNQKGNGYCRFKLQDYDGSMEFGLYKEAYANFKNLIEKGRAVMIDCINAKGYNDDRPFMRINNIELIESVSSKMIKSVTIKLPVQKISPAMIDWFKELPLRYPGSHSVKFVIVDEEDSSIRNVVDLSSKTTKLMMDSRLAKELEQRNLIFKLN
jgi:DNA polymerase-3 subunit alpha